MPYERGDPSGILWQRSTEMVGIRLDAIQKLSDNVFCCGHRLSRRVNLVNGLRDSRWRRWHVRHGNIESLSDETDALYTSCFVCAIGANHGSSRDRLRHPSLTSHINDDMRCLSRTVTDAPRQCARQGRQGG